MRRPVRPDCALRHHPFYGFPTPAPGDARRGDVKRDEVDKGGYKRRLAQFAERLDVMSADDLDLVMGRSILERLRWTRQRRLSRQSHAQADEPSRRVAFGSAQVIVIKNLLILTG